jgi:hypothetical protein
MHRSSTDSRLTDKLVSICHRPIVHLRALLQQSQRSASNRKTSESTFQQSMEVRSGNHNRVDGCIAPYDGAKVQPRTSVDPI